ncbi:hypothetical protein BDR04DRAFT_1085807, partial [Suillus decipiens]
TPGSSLATLSNPCTRDDSHRNYLVITFSRGTDVAKVLNIAIAFAITYITPSMYDMTFHHRIAR